MHTQPDNIHTCGYNPSPITYIQTCRYVYSMNIRTNWRWDRGSVDTLSWRGVMRDRYSVMSTVVQTGRLPGQDPNRRIRSGVNHLAEKFIVGVVRHLHEYNRTISWQLNTGLNNDLSSNRGLRGKTSSVSLLFRCTGHNCFLTVRLFIPIKRSSRWTTHHSPWEISISVTADQKT
jgi:hypothetical protein